MLPVSLDCPFLIVPSVFSYVNLHQILTRVLSVIVCYNLFCIMHINEVVAFFYIQSEKSYSKGARTAPVANLHSFVIITHGICT